VITVILRGRLGNILFQYAVGRHLAARRKTTLRLNLINHMRTRDLLARSVARQMRAFNITATVSRPVPARLLRTARRSVGIRPVRRTAGIYRERHWGYDPQVLQLGDGTELHGFFQSEKYFSDIADMIRRDLTFTRPLVAADAVALARRIRDSQSVSLHVRRGDYLKSPLHNVCTPDYYRRAVRYMRDRLGRPQVFIFSDDVAWCERHLDIPDSTYVATRAARHDPTVDLRLMSLCAHNIIPNSTFSWWAAWLNENPGKIVVAPDRWVNNPVKNARALQDTIPEGWVRLPV